jgi:hypothetical protein
MTTANALRCCELLGDLLALDATETAVTTAYKLRDCIKCFVELSPTDQEAVRSILTLQEARRVASLSVSAAEQGLRDQDEDWITWAILTHDVEQFRDDPRNNIRLLAVAHYAAKQLGADPRELFANTAKLMSARASSYVIAFAERPPPLQTLESMGVRVTVQQGGFNFMFD